MAKKKLNTTDLTFPLIEIKGHTIHYGINKLEYFTASALTGLISREAKVDNKALAAQAVDIAITTLTELAKLETGKFKEKDPERITDFENKYSKS